MFAQAAEHEHRAVGAANLGIEDIVKALKPQCDDAVFEQLMHGLRDRLLDFTRAEDTQLLRRAQRQQRIGHRPALAAASAAVNHLEAMQLQQEFQFRWQRDVENAIGLRCLMIGRHLEQVIVLLVAFTDKVDVLAPRFFEHILVYLHRFTS